MSRTFLSPEKNKKKWFLKFILTLGVSICLDVVSIETRQKRVSLDGRENLDSFKKLVSTIKISGSRTRNLDLVSMSSAKTCRDFCDFSGFLNIFIHLDREITWFLIYLDRDIYFSCRNLWLVRMLPKVSLEKSR